MRPLRAPKEGLLTAGKEELAQILQKFAQNLAIMVGDGQAQVELNVRPYNIPTCERIAYR